MDKVAVLDVGSNSLRMVFAYVLPSKHFWIFDEIKETVRLGEGLNINGIIKKNRIDQAIATLKMFKKLCNTYQVDKLYCISTNVLRRATNQKSFIEEAVSACGFRIKILTEEEEAELIYHGVINTLEIPKGVIVDISGCTFQLIHYNRRHIINIENLQFGTISLTEMLENKNLTPAEQASQIEQFVVGELSKLDWLKHIEHDAIFVGVGGAFRNIASISQRINKYPLEILHNYKVSKADFNKIYDNIKAMNVDQKSTIKGLSSERADIFSAALSAVKAFFDKTKFDSITISSNGLREGVLFTNTDPTCLDKPLPEILTHSIQTKLNYICGETGDCSFKIHAEKVYQLAILLYKEMKVLHKLPRGYVKVLKIAAFLHDCGDTVRYYNHPKHSLYYIQNCGVNGASHREIVLAGFVAALHNGLHTPIDEWHRYKDILAPEDLTAAYKLSIILRLAEGLDRSGIGSIKDVKCDILGDSVIMKTVQDDDCALEIREAMNASGDFAKIFKKNLEII